MISLAGYTLTELIYDGLKTCVYRGYRDQDAQPVLVKIKRYPSGDIEELRPLCNQYHIARNLEIPGILRSLSLEEYPQGVALILEDFAGVSLRKMLNEKKAFNLTLFLTIARQITETLQALHKHRIIHKNLQPDNILIHPDTYEIKLFDFTRSSILPKEMQFLQSWEKLEGTLAYISPEQTGRINRGLDYRTDFYSLGVMFYELLTGNLPFQEEDPMGWIYAHLAKQPPSLETQGDYKGTIPPILSQIVLKLMAKVPQDRYQSAGGLLRDLQKCEEQWHKTGEIEGFELGEFDHCDRFLISDQLYGRSSQFQDLFAALQRVQAGSKELVLVTGYSGIGKTALVQDFQSKMVMMRGDFFQGKFDQLHRNIPLLGWCQAFQGFFEQLLTESPQNLQRWKQRLLQAVGDHGSAMIEVIPVLEEIIGPQPPLPEVSDQAAQNRFQRVFLHFIQRLARENYSLVVFLDDLQWADQASLDLMKLLLKDAESQHLLVIGSYRDNEVKGGHPLKIAIAAIQAWQTPIQTLSLAPLTFEEMTQLIADTLNCPPVTVQPLSQFIFQKTLGNPFFTRQTLQSLYEQGVIFYNSTQGQWQYQLQENALEMTADVQEFVSQQLQTLSPQTQETLKLAACIGNRFDLATLAYLCKQDAVTTASDLWEALQRGLIFPQNEAYKFYQMPTLLHGTSPVIPIYQFWHDRIQQVAYSLLTPDQQQQSHLIIGQYLLEQYMTPDPQPLKGSQQHQQEEVLFALVNQFNLGSLQPTQQLAKLNLKAALKAKAATAYPVALGYIQAGMANLSPQSWQSAYSLTLSVKTVAVEIYYLCGEDEAMETLAQEVLEEAQTLLDRVKVYEVQIQARVAQNRLLEAKSLGLTVLRSLGVSLPEDPQNWQIFWELIITKFSFQGKSHEALLELPLMQHQESIAAANIMLQLAATTFVAFPRVYLMLVLRLVRFSLEVGNSPASIYGYAGYGLILCGLFDGFRQGYQFGQLALELLEKLQVKGLRSKIILLFNCFIRHWQEPLHHTLQPLLEGYTCGLETGDLEFAGYNALVYCNHLFGVGTPLETVERELNTYREAIANLQQTTILNYQKILSQFIHQLRTGVSKVGIAHPTNNKDQTMILLQGELYNEMDMIPQHQENGDRAALCSLYLYKAMLAYFYGEYEQTVQFCQAAKPYLNTSTATFSIVYFWFFEALASLALVKNYSRLQEVLKKVKKHQKRLDKFAKICPQNFKHFAELVAAETAQVLGKKTQAIEHYEKAIQAAQENGFVQYEALGYELAGKFYHNWGKHKIAQTYCQEACNSYQRWNAIAKVEQLTATYPDYFTSFLGSTTDDEETSLSLESLLEDISENTLNGLTQFSTESTTSRNPFLQFLDWKTVLKTSQVIAGEIEKDKLLAKLLQVMMENTGADKCVILLPQQTLWQVVALANSQTQFKQVGEITQLEGSKEVPQTLIQQVIQARKSMVLEDITSDEIVTTDRYFQSHYPKCLLCSPLLSQGDLVGVVYLENSLTPLVFNPSQVELIQLLSAQAAIAIENSQLYQQLQQSLDKIKQTQLQLVQGEKMATLGELISGIAHEINNPVGFLSGNLQVMTEYMQDLAEHLQLYQKNYKPTPEIIAHQTEIDIDYLVEDFFQLLASMEEGIKRIQAISVSMRVFSRSDTKRKVEYNLHEGIDSTLTILRHRLKANSKRPAIQIVKKYGVSPLVVCFPGQMNQVFMNILANAIDALDEASKNRSYQELEANPQQITIQTKIDPTGDNFIITIRDNAIGMSPEVQNQIFDHLFTTKPVGEGTGLGLSISYKIITEKHDGQLTCVSKAGEGTEFKISLPL